MRLRDRTSSAYRARSGPTRGLLLQLCNVSTASCRCVSQLIWQAFEACASSRISAAPLIDDACRWTVAGQSARVVRANALVANHNPQTSNLLAWCVRPLPPLHLSYPATAHHIHSFSTASNKPVGSGQSGNLRHCWLAAKRPSCAASAVACAMSLVCIAHRHVPWPCPTRALALL